MAEVKEPPGGSGSVESLWEDLINLSWVLRTETEPKISQDHPSYMIDDVPSLDASLELNGNVSWALDSHTVSLLLVKELLHSRVQTDTEAYSQYQINDSANLSISFIRLFKLTRISPLSPLWRSTLHSQMSSRELHGKCSVISCDLQCNWIKTRKLICLISAKFLATC